MSFSVGEHGFRSGLGILLCYCRTKVVWACSVALFVACQWVWRRILVPAETHGDCSELKQEQTMQETMMRLTWSAGGVCGRTETLWSAGTGWSYG